MLAHLRRLIPQNSLIRRGYSHLHAVIAATLYLFPARGLKVIAVTGTDGKTTVTEMIARIMRARDYRVLSVSTAAIFLDAERLPSTKRTTPGPWALNRLLKKARRSGIGTVVLEVSSHALSQGRIFGIRPDIAVLTNITPEHLDYYQTLDAYRLAKKALFCRYLRPSGTAVINLDDPVGPAWARELAAQGKKVAGYTRAAAEGADLAATEIRQTAEGLCFRLSAKTAGEYYEMCLPLAGAFNAENAMAAIAAAQSLEMSIAQAGEALASFTGVAGRMQRVTHDQGFAVFVDFALTPAALQSTLQSGRSLAGPGGRVLVVFGSAGNHPDPVVRADTGRIAASLADLTIITDDEPYFENPAVIRSQIIAGARAHLSSAVFAEKVREIADRREAITHAIAAARQGDVVIVTGMGHLLSRNVRGNEEPWSDIGTIQSALDVRRNS